MKVLCKDNSSPVLTKKQWNAFMKIVEANEANLVSKEDYIRALKTYKQIIANSDL